MILKSELREALQSVLTEWLEGSDFESDIDDIVDDQVAKCNAHFDVTDDEDNEDDDT